ncbi:Elongation factor Tu GTP binding domain-containing protein [Amycolatopsis saalfeldensis]|uniref:Elongation factor Tu GTP binding domain-containing protein n=1 Tax=Amycolatopsis saalfeldensis TaxID=394193 RepID=A0A1H8YKN2_9PSEU|nr:Elongation factor Tu GTP binding domain-containing protein [Amycolatopsis saalfeldensis]
MTTLTIGTLAHVDAGKTSLTKRLLFEAGVIGHLGSVDGGDTQTDSPELERRRGITIKSAVVAQTRVLMRTLTRLGLPVLVFVNKIDRMGAQEGQLLDALRAKLSPRCVALSTVTGLGDHWRRRRRTRHGRA